ncbi:MAG TPA: alpha/beta fold hydrolase [Solirubrobacteraceae bacterium]|nr:alpha/beta fold hydrolase [Solirubrobacteraceae bacterium]
MSPGGTPDDIAFAAGLAYREARPRRAPRGTLLCVHGFPESSYMWRALLAGAAGAGWRAVALDLPGSGDSPPDRPLTWERAVAAVQRLHAALELGPVVLAVHDWGGLIGLRWACDHPTAVTGLVVSDTGFFADGRWHGLARALRAPGEGEALVDGLDGPAFAGLLRAAAPRMDDAAIAQYARGFADEQRRRSHLDLYRSGDFAKLAPYEGRLAALGVPALLLWGDDDPFAPLAGAHRLAAQIAGAELVVVPGTGHFVYDDAPVTCAAEIVDWLTRAAPTPPRPA